MDVAGLRQEMERFLAQNADHDAPTGFRCRFETAVQAYEAEGGSIPKSELEAELRQIRNEAEIAVKAAEADHAEAAPPPAEPVVAPAERKAPVAPIAAPEAPAEREEPAAAPAAPEEPVAERDGAPVFGGVVTYGIGILVALAALAGAYFLFRR